MNYQSRSNQRAIFICHCFYLSKCYYSDYTNRKWEFGYAKNFENIKFISLVNLIMDREIVKELIQKELNTENLVAELSLVLEGQKREEMLQNFELLREKLGGKGASEHAADIIVKN